MEKDKFQSMSLKKLKEKDAENFLTDKD